MIVCIEKEPSKNWLAKLDGMDFPTLKHTWQNFNNENSYLNQDVDLSKPENTKGDCFYASTALMIDLLNNNIRGNPNHVKGVSEKGWYHYFVELNGWVLDASMVFNKTNDKKIYIIHSTRFYQLLNITITQRRNAKQFRKALHNDRRNQKKSNTKLS